MAMKSKEEVINHVDIKDIEVNGELVFKDIIHGIVLILFGDKDNYFKPNL